MSKIHNFLGLEWIAGEGIPQYQTPLPGDGEPYYAVSSIQLQAMLGMIELALEATSGATRSIDPSSWLVGFQAGYEASMMHHVANLDRLSEEFHAPQQSEGTGPSNECRSETSSCSASKSSRFQFSIQTSDSSSGCADGESTGELPTPSCKKIVIPKDRVEDVTYDGAGNLVVTLKNGGW